MYNWQLPDWPDFIFDHHSVEDLILEFSLKVGRSSGLVDALPKATRNETLVELMVSEAVKTSEIENEYLSREEVMSSIKRNLGYATSLPVTKDKRAVGIAEVMISVRDTYTEPLTEKMLFDWHRMLMKGNSQINAGIWRKGKEPMQVVSGRIGKEKVHFEAPPSKVVPFEMKRFINWFNQTSPQGKNPIKKAPVRSALAHLYFESIHPFEDGNGRIGRAISEKAIAQGIGRPALLSLSKTIESDKQAYYAALMQGQSTNEVTGWLKYFVKVTVDAQSETTHVLNFTIAKSKFFDRFLERFNPRQIKAINRMLDAGPVGFEGGMTSKKYMSITKTTKATATRDLQNLTAMGALIPTGAGRSTHYELNLEE